MNKLTIQDLAELVNWGGATNLAAQQLVDTQDEPGMRVLIDAALDATRKVSPIRHLLTYDAINTARRYLR